MSFNRSLLDQLNKNKTTNQIKFLYFQNNVDIKVAVSRRQAERYLKFLEFTFTFKGRGCPLKWKQLVDVGLLRRFGRRSTLKLNARCDLSLYFSIRPTRAFFPPLSFYHSHTNFRTLRVARNCTASHRIASHRIASHRIASLKTSSVHGRCNAGF